MKKPEHDFLLDVLRGNESAAEFCELLFAISQVWDDLIDGDASPSPADINQAFFMAVIRLPTNAFYRTYFADLYPVVRAAVYDWLASNDLQKGGDDEKHLAHVLRDSLTGVVTHCAAMVGGHQWALSRNADIRRYFHDESVADYVRALKEKTS